MCTDEKSAETEARFLRAFHSADKEDHCLDTEVHAGRQIFKASKFLLCSKSPVFRATFTHNTEKPNSVSITGFDVELVEQLLLFLHTGKFPSDHNSCAKLFPIADFYDVPSLRYICLQAMLSDLNSDNAIDYYILGQQYNLSNLKSRSRLLFKAFVNNSNIFDCYDLAHNSGCQDLEEDVIAFMKSKAKQIFKSSEWSRLNPAVQQELLAFQQNKNEEMARATVFEVNPGVFKNLTRSKFCNHGKFFKILLIGDYAVGRTALLNRFIHDEFCQFSRTTISLRMEEKLIMINGKSISVQFWELPGHERFSSLYKDLLTNVIGAIVAYDITDRRTSKNVPYWIRSVRQHADQDIPVTLVGTKCDLVEERQVQREEVVEFAKKNRLFFTETSAFDSTNVALAFEMTIAEGLRHKERTEYTELDDGRKCSVM